MGRASIQGSVARAELGQGSFAPGVVSVGDVVGDFRIAPLTNSDDPNLLVNGSVTPKVFSAGPSAGQTWRDVELRIYGKGGTSFTGSGFFGSTTGPSTGLTIAVRGTSLPFPISDNGGMLLHGTVSSITTSPHAHVCSIPVAAVLDGDESETVTITVSENLTGLSTLTACFAALVYRVIP